jgi:hypothetical protein
MKDRRVWKRIKVNLTAKCRLVDFATYNFCRITDIHQEGCCIEETVGFQPGQEIRIVVRLPIEGEIYLVGSVCWSRRGHKGEFSTGIKFLVNGQLAEDNSVKLYSFCVSL